MTKIKELIKAFALVIVLQTILISSKYFISFSVTQTDFGGRMGTMVTMAILAFLIVPFAKFSKTSLSVFPKRLSRFYIAAIIISALILISTPSNYSGGVKAIMLLIYGSVVTPIFEELVFRGFIWNRLEKVFTAAWQTFLINAFLFSIWHIGYVLPLAFDGRDGFFFAMLWKVGAGLCYGLVLGAVRLKTKNCFSTMLLHGVMNVFAI